MSVIERLTDEFARLPGIGSKTALRLVHHLMKGSRDDTRRLARALVDLAEKIRSCDVCGNFSEHELCEVCANPRRDRRCSAWWRRLTRSAPSSGPASSEVSSTCWVGGSRLWTVSGRRNSNIASLLSRIDGSGGEILEVIVATNASVEGEATSVFLEQEIRPLGPRVTRLARGIPVGSDLEYVDGTTIAQALAGRREM